MKSLSKKKPVIFGEVLFDIFPDKTESLGGAAFNVAWNLKKLGLDPLLISRVGNDERGARILSVMKKNKMDVSGIQVDNKHSTGTVRINFVHDEPEFNILSDQAYDFIDKAEAVDAIDLKKSALFYHGSLALRRDYALESCKQIVGVVKLPVFLDVNLRSPWWKKESLKLIINKCRWIKLTENELMEISAKIGLIGNNICDVSRELLKKFESEVVIITKDKEGALIYTQNKEITGKSETVKNYKDSIGAGDAFSSMMIFGIIKKWSLEKSLKKAIDFSGGVCSIKGATTENNNFYKKYKD